MARILVLEDDDLIADAVVEYLELENHTVSAVASADAALQLVADESFDVFILDVMVPGGSGFAVAKEIRRTRSEPILFLTARTDEASRITGFEIGADDYVVKPFSPRELVLRVAALLRRSGAVGARRYRCGAATLSLDVPRRELLVGDAPTELTGAEWRILAHLAAKPGYLCPREELIREALGYDSAIETRAVDTHVKNLRAKLGAACWIETVRGVGYRFGGEPA